MAPGANGLAKGSGGSATEGTEGRRWLNKPVGVEGDDVAGGLLA